MNNLDLDRTRTRCKRRWWGGSVSATPTGQQLSPRGGLLRRRQRVTKQHAESSRSRAETELVTVVSSGSGQLLSSSTASFQGVDMDLLGGYPRVKRSSRQPHSFAFLPKSGPPSPKQLVSRRLTFDDYVLHPQHVTHTRHHASQLPGVLASSASKPTRISFKPHCWEGLPLDLKAVCFSYLGQQGWTKYAHLSRSAHQASDRYVYMCAVCGDLMLGMYFGPNIVKKCLFCG